MSFCVTSFHLSFAILRPLIQMVSPVFLLSRSLFFGLFYLCSACQVFILHVLLSCSSSRCSPISFISLQLCFGLLIFRYAVTSILHALVATASSVLLSTSPNHLWLPSNATISLANLCLKQVDKFMLAKLFFLPSDMIVEWVHMVYVYIIYILVCVCIEIQPRMFLELS